MEEVKFPVGTKVRLKSGGPYMTVRQQMANNQVLCDWFSKEVLNNGTFHQDQLFEVKPDPSFGITSI